MDTVARLLDFIDNSTSPYHTVKTGANELKAKGFTELFLEDVWALGEGLLCKGLRLRVGSFSYRIESSPFYAHCFGPYGFSGYSY